MGILIVQNIDSTAPTIIYFIFEVKMAYRSENKSELTSINLSLKLLNGVSSLPSPYFRNSITSLQELSNRLSMVNQNFNFGQNEHDKAKEWYSQKGVNLSYILEIARNTKKKLGQKQVSKAQSVGWENLEYNGFDDLSIDDFLHQKEERNALFAIMNSFSTNKPSNHMKNLRFNFIDSLNGKKIDSSALIKEKNSRQQNGSEKLSQFVRNYRISLNSEGPRGTQVKKIMENVFDLDKTPWMRILYHQIGMVECLGSQVPNKRNYILTITMKQLEKIDSKERFSFSDSTPQFWKSIYQKYSKGKVNFEYNGNDADSQLLENLLTLQDQINHFQEIQLESTTDLNTKDSFFQRRLKNIVLGKRYDHEQTDLIDQAWMLIITLGLKRRKKNENEKEQQNLFKRQVKTFVRSVDKRKEDLQLLLTSLISLGAFQQIVDLYRDLHEISVLTQYDKVIFICIFITLSFNVELIEQFAHNDIGKSVSRETRSVIHEYVVEIAYFAESLKQRSNQQHAIFVTLLASVLAYLETFSMKDFEQLPERVCKAFKINYVDLFASECSYLPTLTLESHLVRKMLEHVLLNTKVQSNEDYLNLADLCRRFQISGLIEHIFLRFIILHEIDTQETNPSQGPLQPFKIVRPPVEEDEEIFQQILQQLNKTITTENKHVLHFLNTLIELKGLVRQRKVEELSAKKKAIQIYAEDEYLLKLLSKLCEKEDVKLMDVYVHYYEQLRVMYKLIFLSKNNIVQLRRRYTELGNQLESLQKKIPTLRTQRLGKFIAELYQ